MLLESRVGGYVRMKVATEKAVKEGNLESHIAYEDLTLLDSKIRAFTVKMGGLKQCVAAVGAR